MCEESRLYFSYDVIWSLGVAVLVILGIDTIWTIVVEG
jgi:hypothetical protein